MPRLQDYILAAMLRQLAYMIGWAFPKSKRDRHAQSDWADFQD
jgi:hypothetical protein